MLEIISMEHAITICARARNNVRLARRASPTSTCRPHAQAKMLDCPEGLSEESTFCPVFSTSSY